MNIFFDRAENFLQKYPPLVRNSIIGFIVFLVAFPAYLLCNHLLYSENLGKLDTPADSWFPFIYQSILVYSWVYFFLFLPVFVVRSYELFIQVAKAYLLIAAISIFLFIVFPIRIDRPRIPHQDEFLWWGISLNFLIDKPSNCFPSMHVSNAIIAGLSVVRFSPRVGVIALIGALMISVSTLTLKQHYIADVLAGGLIAHLADYLFIRPFAKKNRHIAREELVMPEVWSLFVLLIYTGFVGVMYLAFRFGLKIPLDKITY
jgi:membrane-associated phospholipid phosphatase